MRNLCFLSDDCLTSLANYRPLEELAGWLPDSFADRDLLSRAQVLEMEIFLANFLLSSQGDRVGMAHSVEMRHPFLDYRVIDFAFSLPAKWKIRGLSEKYLLKQAFKGMIPESISARLKQPYRAPIGELFFPEAPADYVDDLLSESSLRDSGYFNANKISRLYAKVRNSASGEVSEFQNMALIGALSTQILHRQFVTTTSFRAATLVKPDRIMYGPAQKGP